MSNFASRASVLPMPSLNLNVKSLEGCEWNAQTCAHAAGNGHMAVLQWARSQRCEWDANTCHNAAINEADTCKYAAAKKWTSGSIARG